MIRRMMVVVVLVLMGGWVGFARGYTLTGGGWPPAFFGGPTTITYSYNNFLDGGLKGPDGISLPVSLIKASVEEAFGLWASVAPLNFVEVPDEGGPVEMQEYDGDQFGEIRFSHTYIDGPDDVDNLTTKALTYFPGSGENLAGDIFFDDSDSWQEVGTLQVPDILGCAIHEIGHALGLNHSLDPTANMYPIFTRYDGPGTGASLKADDIAGIQAIYGAGVGSVTPLVESVPEVGTGVLVFCGVMAGMGRRRKFKAKL